MSHVYGVENWTTNEDSGTKIRHLFDMAAIPQKYL